MEASAAVAVWRARLRDEGPNAAGVDLRANERLLIHHERLLLYYSACCVVDVAGQNLESILTQQNFVCKFNSFV